MMTLKVKDKEYKIKFGYNSFCDTDLMDRTAELLNIFQNAKVADDKSASSIGMLKDLFNCVRELLYVGFRKFNPVETVQEIGDILDDYHDEGTEDEPKSIMVLFTDLTGELMNGGFLGDMMKETNNLEKVVKMPQDHKKPEKN